ncbi:MAG TPA: hypothetical protein VFP00_08720, partial [Burkholderiales bacterium]|nr:hypothetical protein [Burkholderiales bacterium]
MLAHRMSSMPKTSSHRAIPAAADASLSPPRKLKREQPRIALFLLESKKDILRGIAKYVREFGPWRLFLQPTEASEGLPRWLKNWRGDGIIGRITDEATAKLVRGTGLPFVDVRGNIRHREIPLVRIDDEAVGAAAAAHLLERGFEHFGYYGPPRETWAEARRDAFARAVRDDGATCERHERSWSVAGPTGWDA